MKSAIVALAVMTLMGQGCYREATEESYVPYRGEQSFTEKSATPSTSRIRQKTTESCDSNYTGCVPVASDVDCAGGSGNGPAYVQGPVKVIGYDKYGLDRDGDGWGCE